MEIQTPKIKFLSKFDVLSAFEKNGLVFRQTLPNLYLIDTPRVIRVVHLKELRTQKDLNTFLANLN